jgi:hypothetical protein
VPPVKAPVPALPCMEAYSVDTMFYEPERIDWMIMDTMAPVFHEFSMRAAGGDFKP